MSDVLWKIWEMIINVLDCTLIVLLLTSHLKLKKQGAAIYIIAVAVLTFICTLANAYCDMVQMLVVLTIALFAFTLVFTEGRIIEKAFWTLFCQIVFFGVDLLFITAVGAIVGDVNTSQYSSPGSLRLFNMIVTRFILSIIVFLLSRQKTWASRLSAKQTALLCLCPLASCAALFFLIRLFYIKDVNSVYITVVSALLCAVNIIVFFLYRSLTLQYEKLQQSELLLQKKKLEEAQYLQTISSYDKLRMWKHDMANHLLTISELANKAHDGETAEYVSTLYDGVTKDGLSISTGSLVVDAVINAKVTLALENDVAFSLDISLPELGSIKDIDLCAIIGNVLDNAVEACASVEETRRYIDFEMRPKGNFCMLCCRNSRAADSGASLESTKEGAEHGLGVERVKQLVRDYLGWYEFQPLEDSFVVELLLPIESAEASARSPRVVWSSKGSQAAPSPV